MNIEGMSLQELEREQEKHRKQMEANREKVCRRKARTHKLIVMGATVAGQLPGYETMDDDGLQDATNRLIHNELQDEDK